MFSFPILLSFIRVLCVLLVALFIVFLSYVFCGKTGKVKAERAIELVGMGIVYLIAIVLACIMVYVVACTWATIL